MGITSSLVLLAVVWWMTFLIVLPFKVKTQGDVGDVVKGTHAGSPHVHNLRKKALITSGIALVVWIVLCYVILSGEIRLSEIEFFKLEKRIYDGTNG